MPHDASEEVPSWLRKANNDLRAGKAVLRLPPPLPDVALFHAQQAVEKAIKGFLVSRGRQVPYTHDLGELGLLAVDLDSSLEAALRKTSVLTTFAVTFRYPGRFGEPTAAEASDGLADAEAAVKALRALLPLALTSQTTPRSRRPQ